MASDDCTAYTPTTLAPQRYSSSCPRVPTLIILEFASLPPPEDMKSIQVFVVVAVLAVLSQVQAEPALRRPKNAIDPDLEWCRKHPKDCRRALEENADAPDWIDPDLEWCRKHPKDCRRALEENADAPDWIDPDLEWCRKHPKDCRRALEENA